MRGDLRRNDAGIYRFGSDQSCLHQANVRNHLQADCCQLHVSEEHIYRLSNGRRSELATLVKPVCLFQWLRWLKWMPKHNHANTLSGFLSACIFTRLFTGLTSLMSVTFTRLVEKYGFPLTFWTQLERRNFVWFGELNLWRQEVYSYMNDKVHD